MNQATLTPTPPLPPGLAWTTLTAANPSLRSWERSAASAGSRGLAWWCRWASGSPLLRGDVSKAIGSASDETFWASLAVVRRRLAESFEQGRAAAEQAQERAKAAERRQATRPPAPPPRRPKWTTWNRS
jgi:hypothetical protein